MRIVKFCAFLLIPAVTTPVLAAFEAPSSAAPRSDGWIIGAITLVLLVAVVGTSMVSFKRRGQE